MKNDILKLKNFLKHFKFLSVILIFAFYILHFSGSVYAQESTPTAIPLQPTIYNLPPTVNPTSPLYTDLLIHNIFHTFSCIGIGQSVIGQPCLTYQLQRNAQGLMQGVPYLSSVDTSGGVLGTTGSLIGLLYTNRPVRSIDYLATVGQELGFVKEANAQVVGSGAKVLNPIVTLWQVSRNISYVIMIIIFVIIGLMVMFRTHINPQTVITAQAALPGLVIGLIMITFSYFLAGLISDMAFVGTNVVGYYFAAAQGPAALNDPERINLVNTLSSTNVLNIFGPLTDIAGSSDVTAFLDSIMNQLPGNVQFKLRTIVGFLVAQFFAPMAGGLSGLVTTIAGPWGLAIGPLTNLITGLAGFALPGFTLGFALAFIATLALIYAMIRLLLRLVTSFLTIIFLTVTAPFQFLFASLPGRQGIATSWILNMLSNILAFPAVIAVFYFIAFILGPNVVGNNYPLKVSNLNQQENNTLVQTASAGEPGRIVGPENFPLFGGLNLTFVHVLLAFGALMALPVIPDIIARSIGTLSQTGQLIGQEIGTGVRSGQGYAGQFQGAVSETSTRFKQGTFGDVQYQRQGTRWIPYLGRPGAIHIGEFGPAPGGGGAGTSTEPGGTPGTPRGPGSPP